MLVRIILDGIFPPIRNFELYPGAIIAVMIVTALTMIMLPIFIFALDNYRRKDKDKKDDKARALVMLLGIIAISSLVALVAIIYFGAQIAVYG